jgi:hypothetical protein
MKMREAPWTAVAAATAFCSSIPAGHFVQNLGVGLIHGQQRMAGVAILGDLLAAFRLVIAVVAAEAAGKSLWPRLLG